MDVLAPCPSCTRHIRVAETRCPFCDAQTSGMQPLGFDPALAPGRVRSAVLALGASMALGACNPLANVYGGPPIPPPVHDAQARPSPPPSNAPVYGGPPPAVVVVDAAVTPPPPQPAPAPRRRTVQDPGAPVPAYGVAPPRDPERP